VQRSPVDPPLRPLLGDVDGEADLGLVGRVPADGAEPELAAHRGLVESVGEAAEGRLVEQPYDVGRGVRDRRVGVGLGAAELAVAEDQGEVLGGGEVVGDHETTLSVGEVLLTPVTVASLLTTVNETPTTWTYFGS
jgi:hypothetical protein